MQDCQAFARAVSDYLDGAVEAACRAAMDGHLVRCERCRLLCQTMRRTVDLYRRLASACIPPDVEARLMTQLERRLGCK
jgi:anti-sigma factor RsiW